MASIARWCFNHRFLVLVLWIIAVVGIGAVGSSLKADYNNSFSIPGTGSAKATSLLQQHDPAQSGDQDTVVWTTTGGSVTDSAVEQTMTATLNRIGTLPEVASVVSPYAAGNTAQISRSGQTAYALVNFTKPADGLATADINAVISAAQSADRAGLDVEITGQAVDTAQQPKLSTTVAVGFLAAAIVLFLAFGSLTSMLLPLLTAGFGLGIGVSMIGVLTHAMPISNVAPSLSLLIGLGVGVDYALFTVTRYRRGLLSGMAPRDAAVAAMNTSGRAVVFAGATVCVALLGMLVLGLAYLNGMAVAAALTVLFTVLSASTLLPALLGILRMRVLSRRVRRRLAEQGPVPQESRGFWARWAEFVARRPAALAVAALVVLAVLAVPFASLHEGHADDGTLPTSMTSRKAYDQLAEGFGPGFNGPLLLVAQLGSASDGSVGYPRLVSSVERTPGVASVKQLQLGDGIGALEVFPTSAPDATATDTLIQNLRGQVIPAAESGSTMAVYVTGTTAVFYDFSHVLSQKLPYFIGTIVLLGLLLLLLAFRSVAVPLTAAVMNLLGAAASFGVVVAIFQWGWGMNALGLGSPAPIDPFIPVIMFSILFGLSMDYQVFLTSRIHEEWLRTGENRTAVNTAQAQTGRVITAAAAIMICVFFAFALGGQHIIAEFGIGLVAAVLIDAFLVRSVLVPALMHLLGRANWWLPSGLDRLLPHLAIEAAEASAAAGPAVPKPASPAASNGDLVGAVDE